MSRSRVLLVALVASGVYLAAAYLVLPELWRHHEHAPALAAMPKTTTTPDGLPGDPLNVGLVGSEAELVGAFARTGWRRAAALGLESDLEIGTSVILDRPDPTAPVSSLYLFGRREDLAFEQEVGRSARHRNHVRFWRSDARWQDGRPVWLGAASFDRGVGLSHTTGQITHHIAPDIDAERDRVMSDLARVGQLEEQFQVTGPGPTLDGSNGGGDRYFTDGELDVGVLTPDNRVHGGPPVRLASPPAVEFKDWLFGRARPLLGGSLDPAEP